jgi:hypothetical protein
VQREIDALAHQLASAVGLGSRDRRAARDGGAPAPRLATRLGYAPRAMNADELVPTLRAVYATLEAHPDLFGRTDLTLEPPATETAIAAAETALGFPLPADLRAVYLRATARASFAWWLLDDDARTADERSVDLGYAGDEEILIAGAFDLVAPSDLAREKARMESFHGAPGTRRLLPFARRPGDADRYCLDLDAGGATPPVVFAVHDNPGRPTDWRAADLAGFLGDWAATGFVSYGSDGDAAPLRAFFARG